MNHLKNFSITIKLNIILTLIFISAYGSYACVLLNNEFHHSINSAIKTTENEASFLAFEAKRDLFSSKSKLEALKEFLLLARTDNTLKREQVTNLLKSFLSSNKNLVSIYTLWEPDKFDGKDAEYAKKYPEQDGRFQFIALKEGKTTLINDRQKLNTITEKYFSPQKEYKLALLAPFLYKSGNKKTLMNSLVLPIMDGDDFLGIVGTDITLEYIQSLFNKVSKTGVYAFILSEDGTCLAHNKGYCQENCVLRTKKI